MLAASTFDDLQGLSLTSPIPAFADINGDGVLDLILGGKDGRLRVWPRGMCPMIDSASHGTLCTSAQAGTCAAARGEHGGQMCACNTGYIGFRCQSCSPGYDKYADGTCGIPLCAAGKYVATTGGCEFCEPGKFSPIASTSVKCTNCGLGQFAGTGAFFPLSAHRLEIVKQPASATFAHARHCRLPRTSRSWRDEVHRLSS